MRVQFYLFLTRPIKRTNPVLLTNKRALYIGALGSNPHISSPPRMMKSSSWKRISSRSSKSMQELDKSDTGWFTTS